MGAESDQKKVVEAKMSNSSESATCLATVVILTYNGELYLDQILEAVEDQEIEGEYQILVIDSGSTDRTLEIIGAHPRAELVQIPNHEFGHGKTRDMAAHLARGKYVAYLTHDAIPKHSRWLYELIKPFELNDRVGAVLGRQVPRPWCFPLLKYEIRAVFGQMGSEFGTTLFYHDDFATSDAIENALAFYSDVNSCARRDLLTGPIPYRHVSYAEDQLLGRDLIAAGLIKAYAPRAVVEHSNDLKLSEYADRMTAEVVGLYEVGMGFAKPSLPAIARSVVVGSIKDTIRILRDREYSWKRALISLVVNPFYHLEKWRGVCRGVDEGVRAHPIGATANTPASTVDDDLVKGSVNQAAGNVSASERTTRVK